MTSPRCWRTFLIALSLVLLAGCSPRPNMSRSPAAGVWEGPGWYAGAMKMTLALQPNGRGSWVIHMDGGEKVVTPLAWSEKSGEVTIIAHHGFLNDGRSTAQLSADRKTITWTPWTLRRR